MIRKFCLMAILLISIKGNAEAQARVGFTEAEIIASYSGVSFTRDYLKSGIKCITGIVDDVTLVYYFDAYGKCNCSAMMPQTQVALHSYIEYYNNTYVIISDSEWNVYVGGIKVRILLLYSEEHGYFFWYE